MSFHHSLQAAYGESKTESGNLIAEGVARILSTLDQPRSLFPGALPIEPAHALACPSTALRLASSLPLLTECLEGGIPFGSLSEWGLPLGLGGRELVLSFLAEATRVPRSMWTLWTHSRSRIDVYPPAWRARGVHLPAVRFARAQDPIQQLKPLFLDPFFKVIVIDAPPNLHDEDYSFLARQARAHNKIIMVLHDYFLSPRQGNVWARIRMNGWLDSSSRKMCLRVLRGFSPRQLSFDLPLGGSERSEYERRGRLLH